MLIRIVAVAAIACSAALPAVARADKLQIVGSWGSNGQGDGQFSVLKDVAVAPSGDAYTVEDGGGKSNRVQRFSAGGAFLGKAGSEGAGAGQLQDAWSLAVDANGVVFVADGFNEKVTRFNPDLSLLGSPWGTGGSSTGQFRNPEGIAVFGTDAVYVADRGNSQIDRYSAAGSPVAEFGSAGAADGQFNRVVEVVVDFNGDVYAVDRDNNRVQRFDANGGFIRSYGSVGTAPGQLRSPQDVAIDKFGNVWVADTSNMRIEEFASDGRFLANYDQLDALGFHPEGLSFGPNGDLYIADTLNDRILRVQTQAPLVPPPVIGETTTVAPEKGTVLVKLPPGANARAAGLSAAATSGFVPLTAVKSVPLGSTFDTSRGQVKLTSATKQAAITQVGHFGRGLFIPQQTRKNPLTTISMTGSKLGACSKLPHGGSPKATAAARKRSRSLFSNVKGHFRTRGRNSSATVRGTAFTMKDTCAGTVTSVSRGSVTVRDFTLRKNVKLKAHQKYFAKSPK